MTAKAVEGVPGSEALPSMDPPLGLYDGSA